MYLHLENKIILVTGGAKGIGEAICRVLATEGAIPVIVGRNEEDNALVVASIIADGGQAFYVTAD